MNSRNWKSLAAICLLIVLSLLFFHQLAFSGKILARGDTYEYFYPYWDARNAAFREGRLPLWTHDLFMGIPLLANPQIGTFYPPNWLTAPFGAPGAISISILLHSVLAAAGACWLYREAVSKRWIPALAAGLVYAFSGQLGAHVEQINQFQGLAWLPLLVALFHRSLTGDKKARDCLLLALAWSLQIFSGHTQTVFISGVGLCLYALGAAFSERQQRVKGAARALFILACCFGIALLLALPQLLPSLELLRLSNRGGGFDLGSATAFSLPPSMLGRSLLPSFDGQLFSEYISTIGVIGLGLALWALLGHTKSDRRLWIWLLIAAVGLALALGRYNPLYWTLAELPPFRLFRAPARFLALFTLGMAVLAGMGIESLAPEGVTGTESRRRIALVALLIALLIALTVFVLRPDPALIFGDPGISRVAVTIWVGALFLLIALLLIQRHWTGSAAIALVIVELFIASLHLPYNDLAPPEVYLGQRFTISQMLAYQADELVPRRALSISQIYFDPGDIAALRRRYDRLGLDAQARFHALDAVKKAEMLTPNLSLTWGIPTLDGYGGGITPTRHFALYSSLLLPAEAELAVDGRLGERMALPSCRGACIPDLRWLRATDARYIITDKVYDVWHDNIAYDTALARFWTDVATLELPDFETDQARILHGAPASDGSGAIELDEPKGFWLTISAFAGRDDLLRRIHDLENVVAVTLVNSRHPQIFFQLQPLPFERALSSDVKIYQLPLGERAFLAGATQILPDDEAGYLEALILLRAGESLVLHGPAETRTLDDASGGLVEFVSYENSRIALQVNAPAPAYLVLKEAFYPGWQATVNDATAPIYRANLLFRALPVPAGESAVVFRFDPPLWRAALYIGGAMWMIAVLMLFRLRMKEAAP
ncbi:MAG: YfhO family protein [Chloroflexi bacterium]|nr:YfhO family protein [Chloroflexota bacterium]